MTGTPARIATPLVIGLTAVVVSLGAAHGVLVEDAWPATLVAVAFLPLALVAVNATTRRIEDAERARRLAPRLRASLVAAAVVLGTALLLSITDQLGWTDTEAEGRTWLAVAAAALAAGADLLSSRLERAARKNPEAD